MYAQALAILAHFAQLIKSFKRINFRLFRHFRKKKIRMLDNTDIQTADFWLSSDDSEAHAIAANKKYRWLILIALVFSAILEVMDSSILNVALPQMAGTLATTTTDIAWVSTAYLLANVVFLPMTAWLSQCFGRKNYLVACVSTFAISRLMCAFCPSLALICICRLIQGAAGAALISTSQAVLVDIFPATQQGMVQAIFGVGLVVAPATAPLLGGWITDNYSWQVIFYIHIPIALLSLYLLAALYQDTSTVKSRARAGKIDIPGVALLAIGFGSLQYVLEEGERYDWFGDVWITRLTIIAVLGILAMIIWELHPSNKTPVVNLRIYGIRGLWSAVIISFVAGVGINGINYAYAIFLQGVLQFTSIKSGEALAAMGVGGVISLVLIAVSSSRVDVRVQIIIALAASILGVWLIGFNTQSVGLTDTWLPLSLIGFGMGGVVMPVSVAAFAAVKPSESGDASAQMGTGRQLGGAFGIAVINTYIVQMTDFHRSNLLQHINSANQIFVHDIYGFAGLLGPHGYHGAAAQAVAFGMVDRLVTIQAAIKAYNNAFQLIAIIFVCCIPLVFLLKAPKVGNDGDDASSNIDQEIPEQNAEDDEHNKKG